MSHISWVENLTAGREGTPQREVVRLAGLREVHAAFDWFTAHQREFSERQMEIARVPGAPFW